MQKACSLNGKTIPHEAVFKERIAYFRVKEDADVDHRGGAENFTIV